MNDKEKQIEEMAKIIDYQLGDLCGNDEDAAKALYNAGYRKILKNATVLLVDKNHDNDKEN